MTMTTNPIPTLTELETTLERVAIARCIAKRDHWPTPRELAKERGAMATAMVMGREKAQPVVTRVDAIAYLRSLGVAVPPVEKSETGANLTGVTAP